MNKVCVALFELSSTYKISGLNKEICLCLTLLKGASSDYVFRFKYDWSIHKIQDPDTQENF